jgi:hypothetical protein
MTTALTSQLEAINIILEAAEEAPVSSTSLSGLYPLDKAMRILTETSRAVQSVGWKFNTEDDFPLARDVSDNIPLPDNTLTVDVNDEFNDKVNAVQRGSRLYDLKDHSYVFEQDLKATMVFFLDWDELPEPARHYICIRAARTMQGRSSISESVYRYSQDDEQAAYIALSEHEAETGDYNMLRDSVSCASVLFDML